VLYATSGFLQHANCDVRLGWLNYLLSGPEVHRWHHSAEIADANHNYAHTLVVWDLLFGTYHRPHREVGALGLADQTYPSSFIGQMAAPFHRQIVEDSHAAS
jgi:sterol desaturase/sphingolipid hydroxylase (fatty acid hydroxylase superfamily)